MIDFSQLREALKSTDPTMALRELVVEYRSQGVEKNTLIQSLEVLRKEIDEQDEEVILEVLDFLTGFVALRCGLTKIYPAYLHCKNTTVHKVRNHTHDISN